MQTESFIPGKDASLESTVIAYGAEPLRQAQALLSREESFFGLVKLGPDMEGSEMHGKLLAAYDKAFVTA